MNGWRFTRDPSGWRWHCDSSDAAGGNLSSGAFGSLLDCMNDAKRNGYTPSLEAQCRDAVGRLPL